MQTTRITLDTYNLIAAERQLIERALTDAGSIVEAAKLLGCTRHSVKRRIIKHGIRWVRTWDRQASGYIVTPAA
jgi:transcriptional regulator with GAF, ATPase, and Fis domain